MSVYLRIPSLPVWLRLFACCWSLAACGDADAPPPIGRLIDFQSRPEPPLEELGYPRNPDGTYTVIAANGSALLIDPARRTPAATYHRCTRWLRQCYSPPERTLDDCFRSAPRCTSARAWETREECCPAACYDRYVEARRSGVSPEEAALGVVRERTCFPGLVTKEQP